MVVHGHEYYKPKAKNANVCGGISQSFAASQRMICGNSAFVLTHYSDKNKLFPINILDQLFLINQFDHREFFFFFLSELCCLIENPRLSSYIIFLSNEINTSVSTRIKLTFRFRFRLFMHMRYHFFLNGRR